MSHNLLIQNGEASMMYIGGLPWHGLGTRLDRPATAKEAIQAAHLDWQVRKLPLCAVDGLLHLPVRDKYGVARDGSLDVLGVVGRDYTPVQNREAFAFFDPIVGKNAAIYHTAGALGRGERVWILAKLPDSKLADLKLHKATLKTLTKETKDDAKSRVKIVKAQIKALEKLEKERDERIAEINRRADREMAEVQEAIADLQRICADPDEAHRYFIVAEEGEIEENEFNLNLPRYVDTFEPEEKIPLEKALHDFGLAKTAAEQARGKLAQFLGKEI